MRKTTRHIPSAVVLQGEGMGRIHCGGGRGGSEDERLGRDHGCFDEDDVSEVEGWRDV